MRQTIDAGELDLILQCEAGEWRVAHSRQCSESGVVEIRLIFERDEAAVMPPFVLRWSLPVLDIQGRWTPRAGRDKGIPPNWGRPEQSQLATGAPVMTLFNQQGLNRLTFAFSDALNPVELRCGLNESTAQMECVLNAFHTPSAPVRRYECALRIDRRDLRYETALADVSVWWAAMASYHPSPVPEAARLPVYSSWYSFHQNLFDHEQEEQCRLAANYGMHSIIVDDGWQTSDNHGGYAFCGDWEMCPERFPDMPAHVERVHKLGFLYTLWYSMPWVGKSSKSFPRFQGKYLYFDERMNAAALDPRFPEVREYLIGIYERALRDWNLDGFKLDFVDSFTFRPESGDPAVAEGYAGRDFQSLPEAVDHLMTDTMRRLRAIKPEIMIEFRQSYVGPAMRKYGNMFRAGDCPGDAVTNRIRTIDIRLLAGETAVHADMLMWNEAEPVESAALQLLNILFSVPQISVRLDRICAEHRAMLKFYLDFWTQYRDVLLDGMLRAEQPELNYPRVSATRGKRQVTVLYAGNQVVEFAPVGGDELCIVNASGSPGVHLELGSAPQKAEMFEATGKELEAEGIPEGLHRVDLPASGLLKLKF